MAKKIAMNPTDVGDVLDLFVELSLTRQKNRRRLLHRSKYAYPSSSDGQL